MSLHLPSFQTLVRDKRLQFVFEDAGESLL